MNHQEALDLLNDYVDAVLPDRQATALEAHLRECDACREEVAQLRDLLRQTSELPRELKPRQDLWAGISERTRTRKQDAADPGGQPRISIWQSWRGLWPALAGVAAVLTIVFFSIFQERDDGAGMVVDGQHSDPAAQAIVEALDAECRQADDEYTRVIAQDDQDAGGGRLPVLSVIEDNLQIINNAISEARQAWEANPHSPQLLRLLVAAYQAKTALMGQATEIAAQS